LPGSALKGVFVPARKNIEFDLLNNARDSARQAVELLAFKDIGSDHARLKHAITAAAHCIELLLKERLRRIDPILIWEKVNESPSPKARTVNAAAAIRRHKDTGKVTLSPNDEKALQTLRETRNAIEHYEWAATEKDAKVIVGSALSFAFVFAKEELAIDLTSEYRSDDTWNTLLNELHEFACLHGSQLEASMSRRGDHPQYCEECDEMTVPSRGGSCELCGHWQSIDDDA
jgi:hypothetical protein